MDFRGFAETATWAPDLVGWSEKGHDMAVKGFSCAMAPLGFTTPEIEPPGPDPMRAAR